MNAIELNQPLLEVSRANTDAGYIRRLFRRWRERREERATLLALARMQAHLLRDMGIEPSDIYDALDGNRSSVLFNPVRKPDHRRR
jgi:uncharacterized protein YjiS (DUF1127 family)